MKKILMLCFISAIVFLIACAQESKPIITPKPEADVKQTPEKAEIQKPVASDVEELLSKHRTKIQSIHYKYRGPKTGNNFYEFYVKGNRIKYIPAREIQSLDQKESYDAIFVDNIGLTAQSYCLAAYCLYKGKKADLNFEEYYVSTPLDWIGNIKQAKKVGEEVIDDRGVWKLETNKGILWVDAFYGIPLRVEANGKTYKFEQISVNSVKDSDVIPS